jgi:choline dehydrogenase
VTEPDIVIVGAGSAGCALADRLTADGRHRVLLLEAGGPDWSPYIHVPAAIIRAVGNPALDWMTLAEPDGSRFGKVDLWPAGKTLGGSSSINGMLWVRGAPADYDRWAALGGPGWGWAEMAPVLRRLESTDWGDPAIRGREGPMRVEGLRSRHPLSDLFIEAAQQSGLALNPDYNGATQAGVALPQASQKTGRRFSAARGYLPRARARANFSLRTGVTVRRVSIQDGRAVGVEVADGAGHRLINARHVILAAGALSTPKLLMLSGVGEGGELSRHGIPVMLDQPLVGRNLQDHPNATVSVDVRQRTYNVEINSWRMALHMANWASFRRGPATSPYPHAVAFFRSTPEAPEPDIQVMLGPFAFSFTEAGIAPYLKPSVTAAVSLSYPKNSGRVRLRSADPAAPPLIEHELLSHPDDLSRLTAACRQVRAMFREPAFRGEVLAERLPGPEVETDAQWADYLRRTTFLGYHPIATARMGPEGQGVVDERLRVRGLERLRIVDASVIPHQMSGNINAAVIALAERASDLILEDLR